MFPECRGSGNRGEANLVEVIFETVVGNASGLFEAGHDFLDLWVDPAVGTEHAEAVLVDYFVTDACQGEFHVLVAGHGVAIVEILYV